VKIQININHLHYLVNHAVSNHKKRPLVGTPALLGCGPVAALSQNFSNAAQKQSFFPNAALKSFTLVLP
jgi:hypothetical protein